MHPQYIVKVISLNTKASDFSEAFYYIPDLIW